VFLKARNVFAVAYDLQQIFVTDKVEAGEGGPLTLKVLTQCLLNLSKQISKTFKASLDTLDVQDIDHHWAL